MVTVSYVKFWNAEVCSYTSSLYPFIYFFSYQNEQAYYLKLRFPRLVHISRIEDVYKVLNTILAA